MTDRCEPPEHLRGAEVMRAGAECADMGAEIVRLRAEVEALRADRNQWERRATEIAADFGVQYAKTSDLSTRVAKLEAALRKIAGNNEIPVWDGQAMMLTARAALDV